MNNPLARALPWVARMVARQCGIEVRFDPRATTASINANRVITLPSVPAGDHKSAALALGYIVHEAFHAKFSDFEVLDEARSSIERDLMGVYEDARIEATGMRGYPGAKMYLAQAWQIIYERGGADRPTGQATTPVKEVFTYALAHCRDKVLNLDPAKQDVPLARQAVVQRLGEDVARRFDQIFGRAPACTSTWQALLLARETLQCLFEATGERIPQDPPKDEKQGASGHANPSPQGQEGQRRQQGQQGQEGQQGQQAQPASSSGDAAAQMGGAGVPEPGTGDPAEQCAPQGAEEPCTGDAGSSGGATQATQGSDAIAPGDTTGPTPPGDSVGDTSPAGKPVPSWQEDPVFCDAVKADLEHVVGDVGGTMAGHLAQAIVEAAGGRGRGRAEATMLHAAELVDPEDHEQSSAHAAELLARTSASTSALRATIRHLLVSMTDEETRFAPRGRLKPTRLWRLRAGTQNVFEHTTEAIEVDTAITVLLDVSQSMKGQKLQVATEAMMAVSLAIDGVAGISTSVCAFPGRTSQHVTRLKRFGESAQRASARLAGVRAHGSTPLAEALYAVGGELVQQTASGHMLIVVTDGEPNDPLAASEIALNELEQNGVDIVGVGIACDVSHLFARSISIHDQRELAPKLFDVLSERFKTYAAAAA